MNRDELHQALRGRCPHFDPERTAALFHEDQPDAYEHMVRGQGRFPAIRLADGRLWFYDKSRRPARDGHPMKAQMPRGGYAVLADRLDVPEVILVEGEGHAIALLSIGQQGVAVAGGVHRLCSNTPHARQVRRRVFEGKSVRILFDPDDDGRDGADRVAAALMESGATRVSVADLTQARGWVEGDVEDWVGTFENPRWALGELRELLSASPWWQPPERGEEGEEGPPTHHVQSERVRLEDEEQPALVVMTYDEEQREARLAVFAPHGHPHRSVQHDAPVEVEPGAERCWRLFDEWVYGEARYVPEMGGDVQKALDDRRLILPPPPWDGDDTSEELWRDVRDYLRRWVTLPTDTYDVLVAYTFLSYRLHDAGFELVPYFRFYGPPGSGKGRALDVLRLVMWRSYATQPSPDNLHRIVAWHGDITLIFDEFHVNRGRSRESQEKLIDMLNLGYCRTQSLTRLDRGRDGRLTPHDYPLFGTKLFAGYGHDEHESFARRTIAIYMAPNAPVPESADTPELADIVYDEAKLLRSRLLAWRGRKLLLGKPDPTSERAKRLRERAGRGVAQVFWGLVEMVPAGMDAELENIYKCAEGRSAAAQETRKASPTAHVMHALVDLYREGSCMEPRTGGGKLVPTADLVKRLEELQRGLYAGQIVELLKAENIRHGRPRVRGERNRIKQVSGFVLKEDDAELCSAFERHGIRWPPEESDVEGAEKVDAPL